MTVRLSGKPLSSLLGVWVVLVPAALLGCGGGGGEGGGSAETAAGEEVREGDVVEAARALRPQEGTDQDWEVFRSKVEWARGEGLDAIPMGEAMVRIGLSFLGTPYGAGTLEVAGEEAVVVNFQELDCVTFVENVFALARFIRLTDPALMEDHAVARDRYRGFLREIRYRRARVDGYPSRLHYFSDWIRDNEAKGLVKEMTQELGGIEDFKAIDFMTNHIDAYRQLANRENVEAIRRTEYELSGLTRFKIPEEDVGERAALIQNGDIIAATSTVEGLDITHTGLAYWQDGQLHLLHAPLVGGVVEVSRFPLADRILRLEGQDGIRVTRPQEVSGQAGSSILP